jgi:hypothetical protein
MSKLGFLSLIPTDILKVLSAFVMMIPLGWIFRQIKNPTYRMHTSFVWGNLLVILLYNISSVQIYCCIFVNILILKYCNRKKVGKYALIYNMAHNSFINLYDQIYYNNQLTMDSVGVPFMMLILKHISFAYSYQDSAYIEKTETKNFLEEITFKDNYYLYPENRVYVIENFTLYEYVNYILFYPTIVGGPYIEFNDYKKFIELKDEYKTIPSSLLLAIKRFVFGFCCIVVFYALNPYNKVENLIDYEQKYSFLQKVFFYLLGFFYIVRYFGGFSLIEIGCISCGFSYEKETFEMLKKAKEKQSIENNPSSVSSLNKPKLDSKTCEINKELNSSISNSNSNNSKKEYFFNQELEKSQKQKIYEFNKAKVIDWINLLLINDPDEFFRYWNIHVHHFLKRNVYLRNVATPKQQEANPQLARESKNIASSMTFFLSAFWHGFYPNYFIVFFHFYVLTFIGAQVKALNSKINLKAFIPFHKNLVRFIVDVILIPYHCIIFVALDYKTLLDWIVTSKCFVTVIELGLLLILFVLNKIVKGKKIIHDNKKNH